MPSRAAVIAAATARRAAMPERARRRPRRSWREPSARPRVAVARVADAVVQPRRPPLPELDGRRHDAVAAPALGPRHVVARMRALDFGDARLEPFAIGDLRALRRSRRRHARPARP